CRMWGRTTSEGEEMKGLKAIENPEIACNLSAGDFKDRLAWISDLTRATLRHYERRDLVLDLRYAREAADRVRDMVGNEQACCGFLRFDLHEGPQEVRLVITAPEEAREVADALFSQFIASAPTSAPSARPRD